MRRAKTTLLPLVLLLGLAAGPSTGPGQDNVTDYKGYSLMTLTPSNMQTAEQIRAFLVHGLDGSTDDSLASYRAMLEFARRNKLTLTFLKLNRRSAPRLDINCGKTAFTPPDPQPGNSRISGGQCVMTTANSAVSQHLAANKDLSERLAASGIKYLRLDGLTVSAMSEAKVDDMTALWDLLVIVAEDAAMS